MSLEARRVGEQVTVGQSLRCAGVFGRLRSAIAGCVHLNPTPFVGSIS